MASESLLGTTRGIRGSSGASLDGGKVDDKNEHSLRLQRNYD